MNIALLPAQKDFVFSKAPFPAIIGGLGSGKTEAGLVRTLFKLLEVRGSNLGYYMPTHDLLQLRAIPAFIQMIENLGIEYSYNKVSQIIKVKGYGDVIFRSYQNPERIVSYEVAASIVDELDTLNKEKAELVWRKVVERNRQQPCDGYINTIGCVTTPDQGINGFVYEKWGKGEDPRFELIKAKTRENYFLPPDYADQIASNYDPLLAELYLSGEFVNLNRNRIYDYYNRETCHADVEFDDTDTILVGLDFNVGSCETKIGVQVGDELFIGEEYSGRDTRDVAQYLARKFGADRVEVYPDASGGSRSTNATDTDFDILREYGLTVISPKKNPAVKDRINSVNTAFYKHRLWVDMNKCPKTVQALEMHSYDDKLQPEKFAGSGTLDDHNDALGYLVHSVIPVIRPSYSVSRGY